jgi:hypothetical protein
LEPANFIGSIDGLLGPLDEILPKLSIIMPCPLGVVIVSCKKNVWLKIFLENWQQKLT